MLQRSQPSLLPVAAATPDLLRQLARLVAQPSLLGPAIEDVGTVRAELLAACCRAGARVQLQTQLFAVCNAFCSPGWQL